MSEAYARYKANMDGVERMRRMLESAKNYKKKVVNQYSNVRGSYERICAGFFDLDLSRDVPLRGRYIWWGEDYDAYVKKVEELYGELRKTKDLLDQAFKDIEDNIDQSRIEFGRQASLAMSEFDEFDWLCAYAAGYGR